MMPVLIVFANGIGNIGGWVVAHYYAASVTLHMLIPLKYLPIFLMLPAACLKAWFSAALSPVVASHKGLGAKQGAEGVGLATTESVVLSIILIFIANYFLSAVLYV